MSEGCSRFPAVWALQLQQCVVACCLYSVPLPASDAARNLLEANLGCPDLAPFPYILLIVESD